MACYYYVQGAAAKRSGLTFEESPVRLPHREMRDKDHTDPTSDLYLMFDKPGAAIPTPPGTKLLRVPKAGLGVKPARAELVQQLQAFSSLSTNHFLACIDAMLLLGNRLTQRVRFILQKCEVVGETPLGTPLSGLMKKGDISTASYKSFLFFLNRNKSMKKLSGLLHEEPFDEDGEFLEDDSNEMLEEGLFPSEEVKETSVLAEASEVLAKVLDMSDSVDLVGRLFSLCPLQEDDKVLFAHIVLLLAEKDVLGSSETFLQPKVLRSKMFEFYNSKAKTDSDTESAHVFTSLFPLGFKATDNFNSKEIALKTDFALSTSYIRNRQAVLESLKDGLKGVSAFPPACIPFKSLVALSLSYIEGGVALLDRILEERKDKKRPRQG